MTLTGFDASAPMAASASEVGSRYQIPAKTRILALYGGPRALYRFVPPDQYRDLVFRLCSEEKLPVDAVCRLIWAESQWDPSAQNHSGEYRGLGWDAGLMQINSRNWDSWCKKYNHGNRANPLDAVANLTVGIRAFGALYRRQGSFHNAYLAWNAGESRVADPPSATKQYAEDIQEG
jgi:soluble lytic murein transglycosylase-like protein